MNREQLEHLIRAAGKITGSNKLVIIGSQAILGQFPNLIELIKKNKTDLLNEAECLITSIEADIIVPDSPEKADLIDSAIGELSLFHDTHGYYAQWQSGHQSCAYWRRWG